MENEFQQLADTLFWEKIERARKVSPEARMASGPELFDYACAITMTALREQMPGASETDLLNALRNRLAIKRELDAFSK